MAERLAPGFSPRRILIIRLSALGDVIRTLPLLPPLRRRFPEASVDWLCEPASRDVLEPQPDLDRVHVFPRATLARAAAGLRLPTIATHLRGVTRLLRRPGYDLVLDAQGTLKSGALSRLTGAAVRIGFASGTAREFLPGAATHSVHLPDRPTSRVDRTLSLLAPIGADPGLAAAALPIDAPSASRAMAIWEAAGPRPRLLISPGSSRRQAYKQWPRERYGRLARELRRSGASVRISWGPGEEDLAAAVCREAGEADLLLPPTSLALLAELSRQADLFVGNDSGPMHLAWLVGTRVVALYGPTDPVTNAPWGPGPHTQIVAPATAEERQRRDPGLMERIEVAQAVRAIHSALG